MAIAVAGAIALVASRGSGQAKAVAVAFTRAWARQDYVGMYSLIDPATQRRLGIVAFADAYRHDDAVASVSSLALSGRVRNGATGTIVVPVLVRTHVFGVVRASFVLPVSDSGSGERVQWTRRLLFPGLQAGEALSSRLTLPPRAPLLARDGSILASGPASDGGYRPSPLGVAAAAVLGTTGPPAPAQQATLAAEGVPAGAFVGLSGLELALDGRLRGSAGGELLAGRRVLARAVPRAAAPVRSTISPAIQLAAVQALGGQYGGVIVLRPSDGEILAVAGLGLDDTQPPGSTFKMVTVTGVLEAGIASPASTFPYATAAVLDGVQLQNANGEDCGGSLTLAFAVSCNSVFAPLGAKLGAPKLVATAERFGFNHPVGIPGAVESTLPPAAQIQGDLAVGSTAIGQDMVLASPLEMATVASTIADHGLRPQTTVLAGQHLPRIRVTSAAIAHTVRRLMIDVVREGTGTSAAIPGVTVAGKTGTAELTTTAPTCPAGATPGSARCPTTASANSPQNTDAWFAAFAPALDPRIAVCVMLVRDGAGGTTAAPVARQVLEAALSTHL